MKYTVQRGDTLWLIARRFGVSLDDLIEANPMIADPDYIQVGLIIEIPRNNNEYVVKRGDTMWLIAKRFGVSLDDLINANPQISDPNRINVGDVIHLPEPDMNDHENYPSTNQQVHINYINTKKKDTSPITVQPTQQNPPKHPVYQEPLQSAVQEEKGKSSLLKNMHYVVKAGDTLFKIGKMFGVSLPNLIDANKHIEDPDKIYPGNKIIIPVSPPKDPLPKHEEEIKVEPSPTTVLPTMPPMQMPAMPAMPPAQIMPIPMPYVQTMPSMDMECPMMGHCMEMIQMMQMNHMNQMAQMMDMMQPMQMHCCPEMCPLMMMEDEPQQVPEVQQQVQQEKLCKQHEKQEKECHQQQEQQEQQEQKQKKHVQKHVQKGKKVQKQVQHEQKFHQKEQEEQEEQEEQDHKQVQQQVQQNVKKCKRKGCKKCRGY